MAQPAFLRDRSNPCVSANPDVFFPAAGCSVRTAVALCRSGCRNIDKCLAYALEHRIRDGVWGGTTDRDRRLLRDGKALPEVNRRPVPQTCTAPGCSKPHRSKDLCRTHYDRLMRQQGRALR